MGWYHDDIAGNDRTHYVICFILKEGCYIENQKSD